MKQQEEVDRVVETVLREGISQEAPRHHPGDEELAAWMEGTLAGRRRVEIESHLSACTTCREDLEVAFTVAQEFAAGDAGSKDRGWAGVLLGRFSNQSQSRGLAAFALAALVLIALGLPLLRSTGWVENADETADPFAAFVADQADVLRSQGEGGARPEAPNREVVSSTRPDFIWSHPGGVAAEFRFLLVDEQERVVDFRELSAQSVLVAPARFVLRYPDELRSLERGALYAWKVDARVDGTWITSPFVPLRIAARASEER